MERQMEPFEHKGKKFITINGKDYFLIRAYRDGDRWHGKFIFLQVYGKTPLHIEDLPSEDWEIIKTKVKLPELKSLEGKSIEANSIYTAYKPKYFDYDRVKEDNQEYKKLYFIGMTQEGSLFLVFNFLSNLYRIKLSDSKIKKIIQDYIQNTRYEREIHKLEDHGNSNVTGYYVEFERWKMNQKETEELLKI